MCSDKWPPTARCHQHLGLPFSLIHKTLNMDELPALWQALHWYILHKHSEISISFFPAAVLRGIPYKNNSIVALEDIGVGDDALLCITNLTACCQPPYTGDMGPGLGNWFFPNGSRISSLVMEWDFYRSRGQMMVDLNRRRGGEEGIYRCEIPDTLGFTRTIYIGVYSASTCEWYVQHILIHSPFNSLVWGVHLGLPQWFEGGLAINCTSPITTCILLLFVW